MTKTIYGAVQDLRAPTGGDRSIRAVVLRGTGGRAFAAGHGISDFIETDTVEYELWICDVLAPPSSLLLVTIVAILSPCVGGALAVATYCGLRVRTSASRLNYPIARTLGNARSGSVPSRCRATFGPMREMVFHPI